MMKDKIYIPFIITGIIGIVLSIYGVTLGGNTEPSKVAFIVSVCGIIYVTYKFYDSNTKEENLTC